MVRNKNAAPGAGLERGDNEVTLSLATVAKRRTTAHISGYAWRKAHGLLTISDHVRRYRANRHPQGDYRVPLLTDRLGVRS